MWLDNHYDIQVSPTPLDLEEVDRSGLSQRPPSRLPQQQLYFTLCYKIKHESFVIYSDANGRSFTSLGYIDGQPTFSEPFFFDVNSSKRYQAMFNRLSTRLALLGICSRASSLCRKLVQAIVQAVGLFDTTNLEMDKRNGLLIRIEVLRHIMCSFSESEVIDSLLRLSALEYEVGNFGMVPTAHEHRRLKSVKIDYDQSTEIVTAAAADDEDAMGGGERKRRRGVGEKEACTVCLEDIEDFADEMPCGHLFHGTCIYKWLENSHYCPVCRYEMPTET